MALVFGAAISDRVDHGSAASLDDLPGTGSSGAMSLLFWVRPTTLTNVRKLFTKTVKWVELTDTLGNFRFNVGRATTPSSYVTTDTPLATLNKWYCLAVTYNEANSAGSRMALYVGSRDAPLVASAVTPSDGSGAYVTDAANAFMIGGNAAGTLAWQGDIAFHAAFNRELALGECISWQFQPRMLAGSKLFTIYGPGAADWSGNQNNGTITGATPSPHVPLPPWMPSELGWRGSFTPSVPSEVTADSTAALPLGGSADAGVGVQADSTAALPLGGTVDAGVGVQADSSAALPLGGTATASSDVRADSSAALPLGGVADAGIEIGADSSAALPLGGTASATVGATAIIGMTGVGSLRRAVTTDRPLFLRVAPSAPVISLDSTAALPLGGSASASVEDDPTWAWLLARIAARHGVTPFGYNAREDMTVAGGKLDVLSPFGSAGLLDVTAAALGAATPDVDPLTSEILVDGDGATGTWILSPAVAGLRTDRVLTIYRIASNTHISSGSAGIWSGGGSNFLQFTGNSPDPFYGRISGRSQAVPAGNVEAETNAAVDNEQVLRVTRITKDAGANIEVRPLRFGTAAGQWGEAKTAVASVHAAGNGYLADYGYPDGGRVAAYLCFDGLATAQDDADVALYAETYLDAYCDHAPLLWHAGDSITLGQAAQSHLTFAVMTWKGIGTRYDYVNTGVPGSQVLDQKNEASGGQLDTFKAVLSTGRRRVVAVTQAQINDLFNTAQTGAEIFALMLTVWARIREVGVVAGYTPGVDFFIAQTMPTDAATMLQGPRTDLKALLLAAVGTATGPDALARIDLTTVDNNVDGLNGVDYADFIHQNDTGHGKIATTVIAAIATLP